MSIGQNTPPALVSIGLGLWCLTTHSTILQLYHDGQFYWWCKHEDPEQTTDLSLVTDKLLCSSNIIMFYTLPGNDL
jgi:hypothetical protein